MLALKSMWPGPNATVDINVFSQEVYAGMLIAVVVFFLGYLVVSKKSVK
ncbi:hypothetical protein [Olivibacter sitiensis]|nr:hypothetical protein [Olivibacter sitiensis]